jgi:hypothetical protein
VALAFEVLLDIPTEEPVEAFAKTAGNVPVELAEITMPEESTIAASTESMGFSAVDVSSKVPNVRIIKVLAEIGAPNRKLMVLYIYGIYSLSATK